MEDRKIFDLATGELCHYPFVLPTRIHYNPDATCPRWEQFLKEITCGDAALETYLKRMVGYCMTDSTVERLMFMLIGNGCNGKSTFINVIQQLMGDYAQGSHTDLLFGNQNSKRNDTLLSLMQDRRLIVLEEPNQNEKLCESAVKMLVSDGKRITARKLYGTPFEFIPHFKIMITTNHSSEIVNAVPQIIRHIQIVPFLASFRDLRDTELHNKLESELPGIFNWALEGAQEWYEHGLLTAVEE